MAYIGNDPFLSSQRQVTDFTATAGQDTFTPAGGYQLGYVDVYQNGILLVDGTDYTASNGTTVVLTEAASADDSIKLVTYVPRGLTDGYLKSEVDTLIDNIDALPDQTGHAGQFLTTDGTNADWATVDALPSQTGNNGYYLTTDGSSASWAELQAGASAGMFWENDQTLTTSYSITSGKNALSAGPVSLATGVTVTIPSGSNWTIV